MSPYGYVQLLLFGLFCTGAISEETATCTSPRAQSNIDINKVYGDWFLGKIHIPNNSTEHKSQCHIVSLNKVNETVLQITLTVPQETVRTVFTFGNAENAGIWHNLETNRTVKVIYLSADGTAMAMASCMPNHVEPIWILISKQLPISSEKTEEFLRAVEQAGISGHHHFTWESEATCPSA